MSTQPLVSILINNYNYGRFLGQAIESALDQSYPNVEVVVVDDGSTDGSQEIIAQYGQKIIPVLKTNGGQASAFNAGFAASRGEIICFLDADDYFAPQKAEVIARTFSAHSGIDWCFDRVRRFDHQTGQHAPLALQWEAGFVDVRPQMAAGIPPQIPTITSGISMRRSLLDRMLPMPELIRITSDGYIKLGAIALAPGWRVADEITFQRIHGANLYTDRETGKKLIMSKTGLVTGICLWQRFPVMRAVGTRLVSRNIGMCWMSGGLDAECRALSRSFWTKLSARTKAQVLLGAAFWSTRDLVLG